MRSLLRGLGPNVLVLGLVSLCTDLSSEMIYPLLPLFLSSVLGAGPAALGLIEGVAESTAAFLKLASGWFSDRTRQRKPLVLAGYTLSSLARPLIAAATSVPLVLVIRFCDRIGKGVRTAPRDALIADAVPAALRGRAYGFHRAMDHGGALLGPLLATLLLTRFDNDLRTVFWYAALPGLAAVLLIVWGVRETPLAPAAPHGGPALGPLPHGVLRRYLLILLLFTLGNSSDAFLLLKASDAGLNAAQVALLWSGFHAVKMLAVLPFGALSDRIGRRGLIVAGWLVYAAAYAGFAVAAGAAAVCALFAVYALFYGLTEGVEKALLADLAPPAQRGTAFGWYHAALGLGALPASLLFGLLWQCCGATIAFGTGAGLALLAALLLVLLVPGTSAGTTR